MEQIFGPLQKMYMVLCLSEGMRDGCAGKEELKADYQIHSRIYSNAFASMIRYGAQPALEGRDGVAFLTVDIDGHAHSCPARTVKNIMKADFAPVEEAFPGLAAMLEEEEARIGAGSRNGKKRKKDGAQAEAVKPPQAQAKMPQPAAQKPAAVEAAQGQAAPLHEPVPIPVPAPVEPIVKEPVRMPEPAAPAMQPILEQAKAAQAGGTLGALKPAGVFRPKAQQVPTAQGKPELAYEEPAKAEQAPAKPVQEDPTMTGAAMEAAAHAEPAHAEQAKEKPAIEEAVPEVPAHAEPVMEPAVAGTAKEQMPDPAPGPLPPVPEAGEGRPASAAPASQEPKEDAVPDPVKEEPETQEASQDIWMPKPQYRDGQKAHRIGDPEPEGTGADGWTQANDGQAAPTHAFQKKPVQEEPAEDEEPAKTHDGPEDPEPAMHPGKPAQAAPSGKGLFSRFLPKGKKQDMAGASQAQQPAQDEADAAPDLIPHAAEEAHGERICHTHYVMLRKTYGTQVTGPYVVQVWPTEVIEMCPDRMPSAIFVRAQAPNGKVICKVNEGRTKYIVLDIDNKQFNVFGYWEAGKFITEVSAINKTASIYTMSEEVEQECPEQPSDAFLDQFRSREPHRPEFFVVPVSNTIPDGGTVPIAAFIRVKDKNYPVTSKGPGDTLRFSYENQLSEISGCWEDGRFAFEVRAVEEE